MKNVISISLGSSKRDAEIVVELGEKQCMIRRIGTDGDFRKALMLFEQWRGKVDAFGLGGTNLYIYAEDKRYSFNESKKFLKAAGKTPLFDGSSLKINLEKQILKYLHEQKYLNLSRAKVLLVCGVDRIGMAQAFSYYGSDVVYGDLMFGLGIPLPIHSVEQLHLLTRFVAPLITKMPVRYFYPTGHNQDTRTPKFISYFKCADIIAGDFHFIYRYMPDVLAGKTIITNTVTSEDKEFLRGCKIKTLITTTPNVNGRSFGTNALEAALYAVNGKQENSVFRYADMPAYLEMKPSIFQFYS